MTGKRTRVFSVFNILFAAALFISAFMPAVSAADSTKKPVIRKPLYKPFIERYILDELKQIRSDHEQLKRNVTEKVAQAKLESSDRAIRYTADTTNNIFYIITTAASILVLLGWKSLHDMKVNIESVTTQKLTELTQEYEQRLADIEKKMKVRSEQIISNQEEISVTNQIHSLWMRAGLETNENEKVSIYDQILEIKPDDVEALSYKADALLELGEMRWALSLANQAIELDRDYSFAYWQRACAKAELGHEEEAIDDIEMSVKLSESSVEKILDEKYFEKLRENTRIQEILDAHTVTPEGEDS